MKRINSNYGFGDSIEDYELLGVLGKGGFATVYKARSKHTQRCVAIKTIDKLLIQRVGLTNRVRQEVEIHSRLKHPFVVELYTFFQDNNHVYLVMELAENGELRRYIKEKMCRSMHEYEAACILRQVVSGMLYLHSHRIMHRDISLSNLLLSKDMNVKIADFGLAAQIKRENEKHTTMCGTPNFISPEVVSRSPHGLAADVWALGCMLYTLLIGKPPFDANAVQTTLTKVVTSDYELPQQLSPEASDLISKLLKKNPDERIELEQILQHPFLKRYETYDNCRLYNEGGSSAAAGTAAYNSSNNNFTQSGCSGDDNFTSNQYSRGPSQNSYSVKGNKSCDSGILTLTDSSTSGKSYGTSDSYGLQSLTSQSSSTNERFYERPNLPYIHEHLVFNDIKTPFNTQQDENRSPTQGLNDKFAYFQFEDPKGNVNSQQQQRSVHPYAYSQAIDTVSSSSANSVGGGIRTNNSYLKPFTTHNHVSDNTNTDFSRSTTPSELHFQDVHLKSTDNSAANIMIPGIPAVTQKSAKNDNNYLNPLPEKVDPTSRSRDNTQHLNVPPLNTARLQPTRFRTKSVIMSILRGGEVALEFIKFRSKFNEDRITDICWISGDGHQIIIYEPSPGRGLSISSESPECPINFNNCGGFKKDESALLPSMRLFTYENLPNKYWRKYLFGSRFVSLVKSSTPKITYYSAQAKFHLMESNEHFEALFYNGAKITHSLSDGGLKVYNRHGRLLSREEYTDGETESLIGHNNECLKYCMTICETMDNLQRQSKDDTNFSCFPLVIGRRPTMERSVLKEQVDNVKYSSSATITTPMSKAYPNNNGSGRNDSVQVMLPPASKTSLHFEKSDEHVKGFEGFSNVLRHVIIPNIGRAVQLSDGSLELQFFDGSRISKYQKNNYENRSECVAYTPGGGGNTMYFTSQDELPLIVRDKLGHLEYLERDFRNLFQSNEKFGIKSSVSPTKVSTASSLPTPASTIRNITNHNTNTLRYVR